MRTTPGAWRMCLVQSSGATKRRRVRGSSRCVTRPGARTRVGSGGEAGCVPHPAASSRGISRELGGGARMRPKIDVLQMIGREVRVELGRGYIRVAEHLLHRAQVAAAREQVRGERV